MDKEKLDALLKEIAYIDDNLQPKAQLFHIYQIYSKYTGRDYIEDLQDPNKPEEIDGLLRKIHQFVSPKVFQHLSSIVSELMKIAKELNETSNS